MKYRLAKSKWKIVYGKYSFIIIFNFRNLSMKSVVTKFKAEKKQN